MTVFADTSALFVVVDRGDADHARADEVWRRLLTGGVSLLTTNYVLLEMNAVLQRRLGMEAVHSFHEDAAPLLEVQWIDARRHWSGVAAVLAAGRRGLSLVDCVSFEVMRDHGIRTAFCFDEHFREQGFEVIP